MYHKYNVIHGLSVAHAMILTDALKTILTFCRDKQSDVLRIGTPCFEVLL